MEYNRKGPLSKDLIGIVTPLRDILTKMNAPLAVSSFWATFRTCPAPPPMVGSST
jgi:hypothetical protein